MATHDQFLANWVKSAYGMEMGLVKVLEQQTQEVGSDPQFRDGLNRHLVATRHHCELLRDCLQRMGENAGSIQANNPMESIFGRVDGGGSDGVLRTELIDYVTENFEAASYRALIALARQIGDQETVQAAEQILNDEVRMVHALDQMLPGVVSGGGASIQGAVGTGRTADTRQQNIDLATSSFDALNAHDLQTWKSLLADDYCSEAPGTTGSMDRDQNAHYLQNFISAFPDLHFEMLRTICDGECVVVDWEAIGTHNGQLHSPDGRVIPATHKRAKEFGSTTFECKDGKIRRSWVYFDMSVLIQQLGSM